MEALVGEIGEHRRRGHSGVVDQDVQGPLGEPGGACGRGVSRPAVADVEGDAVGFAAICANILSDSRSRVRVDVADEHRRPGSGQCPRDRGTNPAAGTGDQRRSAGEVEQRIGHQ